MNADNLMINVRIVVCGKRVAMWRLHVLATVARCLGVTVCLERAEDG